MVENAVKKTLGKQIEEIFGESASQTKRNRKSEILKIGLHKTIKEIGEFRKKYSSPEKYLRNLKNTAGGTTSAQDVRSWNAEIGVGNDLPDPNPNRGKPNLTEIDNQRRKHALKLSTEFTKDPVLYEFVTEELIDYWKGHMITHFVKGLGKLETISAKSYRSLVETMLQESASFNKICREFITDNPQITGE
jgi:hypothetical protein